MDADVPQCAGLGGVTIETVEGAPRQYKKVYEFEQEIDAAASQAKLELGVLTLTLAKLQPASKAKAIRPAGRRMDFMGIRNGEDG